ncbi:MAG: transposase, partial [Bacteroidetes bacterium]|nr:transposase [Bacteroidota bacterium]
VAISNARIIKVTNTHVTFSWCDRENGYQKKTETISGVEFLKRFLDHIVPPYFRRIRHLGFLSTRNKTVSIEAARRSLGYSAGLTITLSRAQILELRFGERSQLKCRDCGGELHLLETFAKQRAPPANVEAGIC